MNPGAVPKRPTVTVAVATLDREAELERCLASLARGRALPDEVLVVDQGTGMLVEAVVARADRALSARYVHHASGGLAGAQNRAFGEARGQIVAVIDDDCEADEGWLEAIANVVGADAAPDLVAGQVLPLGPETPGTHPVSSRTSTELRDFRGKTLPWDIGSGNNFAVKREVVLDIGGCDERLGPGSPGRGGVDMDLFYRLLRRRGWARYEPAARVYHQRKTTAERLSRRVPYGYGMGACCALWFCEGDRYSVSVLTHWTTMRSANLVRALLRGRWLRVYEELLILGGTIKGLVYGVKVRNAPRHGGELDGAG